MNTRKSLMVADSIACVLFGYFYLINPDKFYGFYLGLVPALASAVTIFISWKYFKIAAIITAILYAVLLVVVGLVINFLFISTGPLI